MKVLLFGNNESTFEKELAENLVKFNIEPDFIDIGNFIFKSYVHGGIKQYFHMPPFLNRILPLVYIIRIYAAHRFIKKMNEHYDLCHLFFIKYEYLFLIKMIMQKAQKTIASVYGSDFLRNPIRKYFLKLYKKVDYITFTNPELKTEFLNYYKTINKEKVKVCPFGISILDYIDKIKNTESIDQSKEKLEIEKDRIIIAVGSRLTNQSRLKLLGLV